jgi:RNA polymerase sigma-70 factor (ECF subfamily)
MAATDEADAADRADMGRLAAGEDAALDRLMARHAGAVIAFLTRMLGDPEDARDLAQEAFVRVYRSRDSYRPAHRFKTWLFTIAANLGRSRLRWRGRHPTLPLEQAPEPVVGGDPAAHAIEDERALAVRRAVAALPDDLREAIALCEWDDLRVADAAEAIGTTVKAVESRLYRARQQLRGALRAWW